MIKTYMTDKELEKNLDYISMKHERDYWRAMANSLRNILEQEKEQARIETASAIYEQLQGHGTTFVKKWIISQFNKDVINKFYAKNFSNRIKITTITLKSGE